METEIKQIVDKIVAKFKPEKVILFGSYAWGKPGKDSDIDFFVIKDDPQKNNRELAIDLERVLMERPRGLDLIVYKPDQVRKSLKEKNRFISKIITEGKILYGN